MKFTPVRHDSSSCSDYACLFSSCFPGVRKFSPHYLDWLYRCNPDGEVLGFDAWDGNRLAAHYVCIPARAIVGGDVVRVLLSLNTATHPDYQGKGLFTKLAELTYLAGAEQNYDCVYGIANANSTPGFVRKLSFQLVSPLRACVGIGALGIDYSKDISLQFQRVWSKAALDWRCVCPTNPVVARFKDDRTLFFAPALPGGACAVVAELSGRFGVETVDRGFGLPLRLYIGRVPVAWQKSSLYVDIPGRLRPSPLNMIYRSLSGRVKTLDPDAVDLSFLDFDAY